MEIIRDLKRRRVKTSLGKEFSPNSLSHLFGAGLDVTDPEPLPAAHPLWSLPNCILTPHVAGVSFGHLPQTEERIWRICAENLERYAAGNPLRNLVREIPL